MELAAAVVSLSCKAVIVANDLYELHSRYKEAGSTIDAICHEVEVVRASLSRVQRLLEKDSVKKIGFGEDLRDVFDMAITGCTVVLSCLDEEIKKLLAGSNQGSGFGWKVKAKYLWKEDTMMDLLQKLRGQQGAISLLFQSLQMETLSELHRLLREQAAEVNKSQAAAESLRQAHPNVNVPSSIFNDIDSETGSMISNTEFSFDDEIINSKAYRRALSIAQHRRRPRSPDLEAIPETGNNASIVEPVPTVSTEDELEASASEADSFSAPATSPPFTDPPPAYQPPLPPIDTSTTMAAPSSSVPSISSPLSITLPSSSSSYSSSATTTPTSPHTDFDPLSAAIHKSLASFKLRAPTDTAPTVPNRPPIPLAPRLDTSSQADDDDDDDTAPSTPSSDRPPSYATADGEKTPARAATRGRRQKREKALRRAQEKAVARAQKRAAGLHKALEAGVVPVSRDIAALGLGGVGRGGKGGCLARRVTGERGV